MFQKHGDVLFNLNKEFAKLWQSKEKCDNVHLMFYISSQAFAKEMKGLL